MRPLARFATCHSHYAPWLCAPKCRGVTERSTTRMLVVPYTFKFGSTTPFLLLGSIEHVPTVSVRTSLVKTADRLFNHTPLTPSGAKGGLDPVFREVNLVNMTLFEQQPMNILESSSSVWTLGPGFVSCTVRTISVMPLTKDPEDHTDHALERFDVRHPTNELAQFHSDVQVYTTKLI